MIWPFTRKPKPVEFVPVIFANGQDDDLPGIIAAISNERVQFLDQIYEPNEALTITNTTLRLSSVLVIFEQQASGTAYKSLPTNIDVRMLPLGAMTLIEKRPGKSRLVHLMHNAVILGEVD